METIYLEGVGKKIKKDYLNKRISDSKVIELYKHNEKEATDFSSCGFRSNELLLMLRKCHNPLLRRKLQECIILRDELSKKSAEQNKLSFSKLSLFKKEALGIGLRKVIRTMKKASKKEKDNTLKKLHCYLKPNMPIYLQKTIQGILKTLSTNEKDVYYKNCLIY